MKRRTFLQFIGLAPATPLIAKLPVAKDVVAEVIKKAAPIATPMGLSIMTMVSCSLGLSFDTVQWTEINE